MGKIIFKPTCSHCGSVIHGEVRYEEIASRENMIILPIKCISPGCCRNCGTDFDQIVIPWHKGNTEFRVNMDKA